jgi:glycosyltransferase involved in cell wall biosynthesis
LTLPAELNACRAAAERDPGLGDVSRALNTLHVDPELRFGGGETQVLGLIRELRRAGHEAELACDPRGELWRRAREDDIARHGLTIRNAADVAAALSLRKLVARGQYDVVHFHTSRAHALAPLLAGLGAARVVTRRMDYRPNRLLAPLLFNRAVHAVAAISESVADALTSSGVAQDRITVIESGVDCERFHPPNDDERRSAREALGLRPDEIAIGTAGALTRRKGQRVLIDAVARMRFAARFGVRAFIAGDGPLLSELANAVSREALDDAVRFMGELRDVRRLLHALDVFAMPSLAEGLGVAALEAMASGLPVVASAVGGLRDAIADGETGLLVPPNDARALTDALERLATDPELRRAMGAAGRRRAQERFSMAAMARGTLALYQRCLAMRIRTKAG